MIPYLKILMLNSILLWKRRTRERLLHFFERDHAAKEYMPSRGKVISEFSRSAAGMRSPIKQDLRTPGALSRTVEYLLEEYVRSTSNCTIASLIFRSNCRVLPDKRKPFNVVYDFIFDRLRAVRQEIVIQNLDTIVTVRLLEPIVLFLAYSAYR